MKKILAVLCLMLNVVLLAGAVHDSAPVLPTRDFYVNDYVGIMFGDHRTEISRIAGTTYEETGVQVVLLVVDQFNNMEPQAYADTIISKWDIGGSTGQGVLLLVNRGTENCYLFTGKGLSGFFSPDSFSRIEESIISPFFKTGNYSTGIRNAYREITRQLYVGMGLEVYEELEKTSGGGITLGAALFFIMALACVIRSFYVTSKYRKKYWHRHQYKRRHFSMEAFYEDEDAAAMRSRRRAAGYGPDAANVKRRGIIIYHDEEPAADSADSDCGDGEK